MTPVDILHAIVTTEEQARALYSDAKESEKNLALRLESETAKLRDEIFRQADAEIAAFEKTETAKADRAIEELDSRLKQDLERAKAMFEQSKSALADKFFKNTVSADA